VQKHLIAFSLYGNNPRYLVGALRNAEIALNHLVCYQLRFYCSKHLDRGFLKKLESFPNVEVVIVEDNIDSNGMFWRFTALENKEGFASVLIRDVDSRLSKRELLAHNDFMYGNKHFHIMKDHETGHSRNILGGLFSCKGRWGSFIPKFSKHFRHSGQYGADMAFLDRYIYPIIKWDALVHDSTGKTRVPFTSTVKEFPSKKTWRLDMVGAAVDENEQFVYADDIQVSYLELGRNQFQSDWTR
jgi:hypothetical protein